MALTPPKFWYEHSGILAKILSFSLIPISCLYQLGSRIQRVFEKPRHIDIPVICIGNLNIGGVGKTPTCIALSKILTEHKVFSTPAFLTRGYGGAITAARIVDDAENSAIWGDEPLLLNKHAMTVVSRNRAQGAQRAKDSGADFVIMDDGLQNKTLHKDVSLVVIDGTSGFGNKKTIPAGPLRETLEKGFARADGFIIIGEDNYGVQDLLPKEKPLFFAKTVVRPDWNIDTNSQYVAFCGIAHPIKFQKTLADQQIHHNWVAGLVKISAHA